jgi:hypothetical protein
MAKGCIELLYDSTATSTEILGWGKTRRLVRNVICGHVVTESVHKSEVHSGDSESPHRKHTDGSLNTLRSNHTTLCAQSLVSFDYIFQIVYTNQPSWQWLYVRI